MNGKVADDMIVQAAKQVGAAMLASLPAPEECHHEFLPGFERAMERLIRKTKRRARVRQGLRSIAVAALVVVIGLSAWLAVDTGARAAVVEWIRTVYEDSIIYEFFHTGAAEDDASYRLGWVPDGYTLVQEVDGEVTHVAIYQKGNEVINFIYSFTEKSSRAEFFPENSETEPVTVLGKTGEFYAAKDEGETNELIWFDEESGILFSLSGSLDKETMLKMANSMSAE